MRVSFKGLSLPKSSFSTKDKSWPCRAGSEGKFLTTHDTESRRC